MKKNKTVKTGMLVAIGFLAVGFAAVTTTLNINGTAVIGSNSDEFNENVVFSTETGKAPTLVDSTTKTTTAPTVSADGKTITFQTPAMDTINETVTLSYNVQNKSTEYNAKLGSMACTVEGTDAASYVTVTPANGLVNTVVNAGSTTATADTVEVKMIKSYVGDTNATYTINCTMTATAESK